MGEKFSAHTACAPGRRQYSQSSASAGCVTVALWFGVCMGAARALPTSCNATEYWSSLTPGLANASLVNALHDLVLGHTVLPYTSSSGWDVWKALGDVDRDPNNASNVIEIYTLDSVPYAGHGSPDSWNREHLWPKSYGVGTKASAPPYTDVHHLRPSSWGVNSARSNLYFNQCSGSCTVPAHKDAAPTTGKTPTFFMPPTRVRGDIARALFYMVVRYRGEEADVTKLVLSDEPDPDRAALGMLTTLLEWHHQDPVNATEVLRNDRVCELQGNRNPFIDHPELVDSIDWAAMTPAPAPAPGPAPAPPPPPPLSGAVAVIGMFSAGTDGFAAVALHPLKQGAEVLFTDNGWNPVSNELKTTEGTVTLRVVASELPAGTVLRWANGITVAAADAEGNTLAEWTGSGPVLSTSGDQVLVYTGTASSPSFLWAMTASGEWIEGSNPSSTESGLPPGLEDGVSAVAVAKAKNTVWGGNQTQGTPEELARRIANRTQWAPATASTLAQVSWSPFKVTLNNTSGTGNSTGGSGDDKKTKETSSSIAWRGGLASIAIPLALAASIAL